MSALALYLKKSGYEVCGSDIESYVYTEDELRENQIEIFSLERTILDYVDVIIVGHSFINKDLKILEYAKKELIPIYEYNDFLNLIQESYRNSVAICGSHGKTTMTKLMQSCLNLQKTVSSLVGDGTANVETKREYFVFEACEYKNHFHAYFPNDIILLNIDYDHNDFFKNTDEYINSFKKFIDNASDNIYVHEKYAKYFDNMNIYTFGCCSTSTFYAQNIILTDIGYSFDFYAYKTFIIHVDTKFFANFMVEMCVVLLGFAYINNFDLYSVVKSIPNFGGVKKRNQEIIINDDIYVIDYAHHPNQMKVMIELCHNKYKNRKIVAIYKPDRYSRVKQFYKEIAQSLLLADLAYVADFPLTSIKDIDDDISIKNIVDENQAKIKYFKDIEIKDFNNEEYYVFLLMSSKDINPILKKVEKIRL